MSSRLDIEASIRKSFQYSREKFTISSEFDKIMRVYIYIIYTFTVFI